MYMVLVYTWGIVVNGGEKIQHFVSFALQYFLNYIGELYMSEKANKFAMFLILFSPEIIDYPMPV